MFSQARPRHARSLALGSPATAPGPCIRPAGPLKHRMLPQRNRPASPRPPESGRTEGGKKPDRGTGEVVQSRSSPGRRRALPDSSADLVPRFTGSSAHGVADVRAVTIRLNGETFELAGPLTVEQLLDQLNIDPRRVAVEHNLTIIKRERRASVFINEGDEVEIVNFVGGG